MSCRRGRRRVRRTPGRQSAADEAFLYEGDEAGRDVADGLELASLAGGDCGSLLCCDHAQEVLAEFPVQDEHVDEGRHVAGKDEAGKGRKVQENVCEGVKHLAEVADLIVPAGKVAVQVVRELGEGEQGNQHEGQGLQYEGVLYVKPDGNVIQDKEDGRDDNPRQSEFV